MCVVCICAEINGECRAKEWCYIGKVMLFHYRPETLHNLDFVRNQFEYLRIVGFSPSFTTHMECESYDEKSNEKDDTQISHRLPLSSHAQP